MASTLKFTDYCKEKLRSEPQSYDNEVFTIMTILSTDPFNKESFNEISNKMLHDYQKLNYLTHLKKIKNMPLLEKIVKDARFPQFVKEVEKTYKIIQDIINKIKNRSINDNTLTENVANLIGSTNNIHKMRDLKDAVLSIPYRPRQLGLFHKIFLALGIASSYGSTNISNKNVDINISNKSSSSGIKSDTEIFQPEIERRMDADNLSFEQASNIVLKQKMKEMEETRLREEEKAKAFMIEYKLVLKTRKDVIKRVDAALAKSKMPTDYLTSKDIKSLIYQESRFDPNIVSNAGAHGLMQVMGDSVGTSIEDNIAAGLKILKEKDAYCVQHYPDWDKMNIEIKKKIVFSIYNCGEGTWEKFGSSLVTAPSETKKHIEFIDNYKKYSS